MIAYLLQDWLPCAQLCAKCRKHAKPALVQQLFQPCSDSNNKSICIIMHNDDGVPVDHFHVSAYMAALELMISGNRPEKDSTSDTSPLGV